LRVWRMSKAIAKHARCCAHATPNLCVAILLHKISRHHLEHSD
jgi:hypothetical protein